MHRHPCFNEEAHYTCGRIHLPVAPECNIQCAYCDRKYACRNENRPGVTAAVWSPDQAVERVREVVLRNPEITVAGIAGPGEPLANDASFETLDKLRLAFPELMKCVSTNGLLLADKLDKLLRAGVSAVTVTVNTLDPLVGKDIYAHILYNGRSYSGVKGAGLLLEKQLEGIALAVERKIPVKVNTLFIPGINNGCIEKIARKMALLKVSVMNLVPLIPVGDWNKRPSASREELAEIRKTAARYLPQFRLCRQCRADAAGIPGKEDRVGS